MLFIKVSTRLLLFRMERGIVNTTGNRALSKGGTGDTLTGMLLASVNTHNSIHAAVANAVFIHGACGDEWIRQNGVQTMSAHDFDRLLPKVCYDFSH